MFLNIVESNKKSAGFERFQIMVYEEDLGHFVEKLNRAASIILKKSEVSQPASYRSRSPRDSRAPRDSRSPHAPRDSRSPRDSHKKKYEKAPRFREGKNTYSETPRPKFRPKFRDTPDNLNMPDTSDKT